MYTTVAMHNEDIISIYIECYVEVRTVSYRSGLFPVYVRKAKKASDLSPDFFLVFGKQSYYLRKQKALRIIADVRNSQMRYFFIRQ